MPVVTARLGARNTSRPLVRITQEGPSRRRVVATTPRREVGGPCTCDQGSRGGRPRSRGFYPGHVPTTLRLLLAALLLSLAPTPQEPPQEVLRDPGRGLILRRGEQEIPLGRGAFPRFDFSGDLWFERSTDDGHHLLTRQVWVTVSATCWQEGNRKQLRAQ